MELVVMGMHRSGTSALMGVLRHIGCHVGHSRDFSPADEANPRGFFEHGSVRDLDETILGDAGVNWYRAAEWDTERLAEDARRSYEERAAKVVAALDRHRPWAIKDPRLCVLFPIWRAVLRSPVILLVYRHPSEVALSLQQRDGFTLPFGMALWEHYTRTALRDTDGLPRILVRHRDLLDQPRRTVRRLVQALESSGIPGLSEPSAQEVDGLIDRSLRRQVARGSWVAEYPTPEQQRLVQAFEADSIPDAGQPAGELNHQWMVGYGRLKQERDRRHAAEDWAHECARLLDALLVSGRWRWGGRVADLVARLRGFGRIRQRPSEQSERMIREFLDRAPRTWPSGIDGPRAD